MLRLHVCGVSLIVLSVAGCGAVAENDDQLVAPPPGQAVEVSMQSNIAAGMETERCKFFRAPEEGLWVNRQEVHYTAGSHHVLLFTTPYDKIPQSGVFECPEGAPAHWEVDGVVGGAQSPEAAGTQPAPPGVAIKIPPGKVLLMNTHYLNATCAELQTDARVKRYTVDTGTVTTEAGVMFFYNFYIRVPAHTESEARMRCPISKEVKLLDAQSHMHKRGVDYTAELVTGGQATRIYQSDSWENVPIKTFGAGMTLPAGSTLDYRCHYRNDEDRDIMQGLTTRDEMCMFVGIYYPRDRQLEHCALDESWYTSDLAATHVGHGTTACGDSLACLTNARGDDKGESYTACVDASCPAAADALWEAERCRAFGTGCDEECKMKPSSTCDACIEKRCAAAFASCRASHC